jgi:putative ABC transport system substrate-binding protein
MSEKGKLPVWRAFFQRLRQLGYVEGQNLAVARYSGEGRVDQFAELTREVVRGKPDVVFVTTNQLALDVKSASDTIPVVAMMADPVADGTVPSLARPGGNITGTAVDAGEISFKSLELLKEMVPSASRVGLLTLRWTWERPYAAAIREAAQSIKITLIGPPLDVPLQEAEYRRVLAAMTEAGADALIVRGDPQNYTNRRLIVELTEKARLPAIYYYRDFAEIGGLMVYGVDLSELFGRAADQVDQIFKGAKPEEIPVFQPTKFELIINLKTAKALGIEVPASLLARADEVIE